MCTQHSVRRRSCEQRAGLRVGAVLNTSGDCWDTCAGGGGVYSRAGLRVGAVVENGEMWTAGVCWRGLCAQFVGLRVSTVVDNKRGLLGCLCWHWRRPLCAACCAEIGRSG
jgi:hypothetical protein